MSDRYYSINGNLYLSVTTALLIIRKPFLERWRGELGNEEADRVRDKAGDLGSQVHNCCQALDEGKPYIATSQDVEAMVTAYREWAETMVKAWVKIEEVVKCDHYQYAGRLDRVAILKGDRKPTVLDLKTSSMVSKDMGLQLAAYQHCLEDAGITPHRRIVLHLDKKSPGKPPKAHEFFDYQKDFRLFLYSLELYKYFEGGKKNVSIVSA